MVTMNGDEGDEFTDNDADGEVEIEDEHVDEDDKRTSCVCAAPMQCYMVDPYHLLFSPSLPQVCKEVRSAARIVGDALLFQKLEIVLGGIKRGIVAAPSLYTI